MEKIFHVMITCLVSFQHWYVLMFYWIAFNKVNWNSMFITYWSSFIQQAFWQNVFLEWKDALWFQLIDSWEIQCYFFFRLMFYLTCAGLIRNMKYPFLNTPALYDRLVNFLFLCKEEKKGTKWPEKKLFGV